MHNEDSAGTRRRDIYDARPGAHATFIGPLGADHKTTPGRYKESSNMIETPSWS